MTGPIGSDDLRRDTVIQVAKLMAAAAITAPKSGGQPFLAGKHNFVETVIIDDGDTRHTRRMDASTRQGTTRDDGARNKQQPRADLRPRDAGT